MNKKSLNTHKTNFRKMIKDERTHPRTKLLAELFLAHLDEAFPRPLLEALIVSEFIKSRKSKEEEEIEELIDKKAMSELKDQWNKLMEENESNSISTNQ